MPCARANASPPASARLLRLPTRVVEPEPWTLGVRLRAEPNGVHRLRVEPGSAADGATVAELAESVGDGHLHLTVRGNVELRGIRDATALADGLTAAGLLPSTAHERARNIVASPFAGLDAQGADTGTCAADLVRALDAAICAEPGR